MPDLGLYGLGHAADKHWQSKADGNRLAGSREDSNREVQRLVNDHVVGGSHEVGLHFLSDRHHTIANDLHKNRINRCCALVH